MLCSSVNNTSRRKFMSGSLLWASWGYAFSVLNSTFCCYSPIRMSKVLQVSLPFSCCPLPDFSTSCPMPRTGKYPTEKNGLSESWASLSVPHVSPGPGSSNLDWSVALLLLQTDVLGFYLALWLPSAELLACYIPLFYSWKLNQTMFILFHFNVGSIKNRAKKHQDINDILNIFCK